MGASRPVILPHQNDGPSDRLSRMNPSEIQPSPTSSQVERLQTLRQLFYEWTLEDRQLSLKVADRLHVALEKNRGLLFRSLDLK